MVAVLDKKLVFGRDQVVTSTQASKNFGEVRRRAQSTAVRIGPKQRN